MGMTWMIFWVCLITAVVVDSKRRFQCHHSDSGSKWRYSPDLIRELRDFEDLIPKVVIDEIIAEHMLIDSGFRKAIKFIRSNDFKQLQRQAEKLPEIIEVINFVHLNDTTTCSKKKRVRSSVSSHYIVSEGASINNNIETVVVLLPSEHLQKVQPQQLSSMQTFIGFVREILGHVPRDRFVALIEEKRNRSAIFGKFYSALRSDQFRPLVENVMKSQNVISLTKVLESHAIDAESLKTIGFEVISWGPSLLTK